ncbi:phage major capsid protein [Solidesulfovibrio sp.]
MKDLLALRKERAEKVDKMEALLAEFGDKDPTDDQTKAFADIEAEIKSLDGKIDRAVTLENVKAKSAVVAEPNKGADGLPHFSQADDDHGVKGANFGKFVRAMASGGGKKDSAAAAASKMFGEQHPVTKALAASVGSAGGFLVPVNYSNEVIELLRARAVVRRAGAVVMPMSGTLLVPRINSGTTASYVGENNPIGKTGMKFGQIQLNARKLAAVVPISNDLLRANGPAADGIVANDIVAGMALTEDSAFLRGDGTENAPKGISNWINAGNIQASAGTSVANIETDLKFCLGALLNNNVRMLAPAWVMPPRSRIFLEFLRDGSAANQLVFPEVATGKLKGYPIFESNTVPTNLGGGTATELFLSDMADAVIGEESGIELMVSDTAAYNDGGTVVAAFSQDQTVVRAIARHDFCMRHDRSAAIVTGVTWGA